MPFMRRLLALVVVVGMLGAAAYACDSDSFGPSDATASDASADLQAAFCSAENQYAASCKYSDVACVQADLANCASAFAAMNPALAKAYVACVAAGGLSCPTDLFATLVDGGCVQQQLVTTGFVNDGGALAMLRQDFCAMCGQSDQVTCRAGFDTSGFGYLASVLADTTISKIDVDCAHEAGVAVADDAGACIGKFVACELIVAAAAGPAEQCDGS